MKSIKLLTVGLLSGSALAVMAGQALALDGTAFAESLADVYAKVGYQITFGPATVDGANVVIEGAKVTIAGVNETDKPLEITTPLTFTNVAEVEGGYTADSLTVPDIDQTVDGVRVEAKNLLVEGIWVPAKGTGTVLDTMEVAAAMSVGPIKVSNADGELVAIESIAAENTFAPESGGPLESVESVINTTGIKVDLTSVKEAEARAVIDALGLNVITGSSVQTMNWSFADGHFDLTEASITLDNLGKLDFTLGLTGYTVELMTEMMAFQEEIAALQKDGKTEEVTQKTEEYGKAMLAKLALSGMSVRYDDASLAGKLLDFFAAAQGAKREEMVAGLKMMVPAMLAGAGDHPIIKQASDAVSAFLDNPQSIEVAADPEIPVPFTEFETAEQDPFGLIDKLSVTITANEAR